MALVLAACESSFDFHTDFYHDGVSSDRRDEYGGREVREESRNVLLLYSAGFNSLSGYLEEDIRDLLSGELPSEGRIKDVLLVYSHLPVNKGAYATPSSPVLTRVYKDIYGNVASDTLVVYPSSARSASAAQLNEVLTYVRDNFPAKTYGIRLNCPHWERSVAENHAEFHMWNLSMTRHCRWSRAWVRIRWAATVPIFRMKYR